MTQLRLKKENTVSINIWELTHNHNEGIEKLSFLIQVSTWCSSTLKRIVLNKYQSRRSVVDKSNTLVVLASTQQTNKKSRLTDTNKRSRFFNPMHRNRPPVLHVKFPSSSQKLLICKDSSHSSFYQNSTVDYTIQLWAIIYMHDLWCAKVVFMCRSTFQNASWIPPMLYHGYLSIPDVMKIWGGMR